MLRFYFPLPYDNFSVNFSSIKAICADEKLCDLCASVVPQIRFEIRTGRGKAPEVPISRQGAICQLTAG
ncbi:hypothetical protein QUB30_33080 [Microcoleus sp. BROC3]